ncbi:hypothetical protein JWG39_15710 [Desulforhopalus vacuolatus]|uniref:hypothetical protein n=1 Tax=Desulforhopalus vacuolatus TaxID=40414 RepID=UPI0019651F9C|nr:hypothetical protein [Desulforhopalus vacuolatus]MBM9521266.1 hypothetical protein [Desulforhopalus vacuolatus]
MQYLPYIQMAILLLLAITCVYLLLVSRSNKRDLQEIKKQLEEIENNSSINVKYGRAKDSPEKLKNITVSHTIKQSVSKHNDLKHIIIEFCRNINSNKCFIVLEEMNDEYTKMIIPTGEIKDLENSLFKDFEELSLEELLVNDYITRMQIDSYFNYIGKQTERFSDNDLLKKINENNEPPYLKSYRAMLSNPDTWPSKMLETIKTKCPITQKRLKEIMDSKYEYSPSEANGSFGASLRMLLVDGYIKIEGIGDSKIIIA